MGSFIGENAIWVIGSATSLVILNTSPSNIRRKFVMWSVIHVMKRPNQYNFSKMKSEVVVQNVVKKMVPTKVKSYVFQLTADEAKETLGVVSSTILVNSLSASVLFDSGVDYLFVSHEFRNKLSNPLLPLEETNVIEVASGEQVSIGHSYHDCCIERDGGKFDVLLFSISVRGFDMIIGMDWLEKNHAKIACDSKLVSVEAPSERKIIIYLKRNQCMKSVITTVKA